MEHNKNENTKEKLLKLIETNKLSMRPKFFFTARVAMLAILAFLVLFISTFIFNFMLFSIRMNASDTLLGFGPRGIGIFMTVFPWHLLLLDIVLIIVLEKILRKFHFSYKKPVLITLAAIFLLNIGIGAFVDRGTQVNDIIVRNERQMFPHPVVKIYRGVGAGSGMMHEGLCHCVVTEVSGDMMRVKTMNSEFPQEFTVVIPPMMRHATSVGISEGDFVMIAGDRDGNIIRAFGVRRLAP